MSDDAKSTRRYNESAKLDSRNLRRFHRAMLERIGQELKRRYEPPRHLPHRLLMLLVQINEHRSAK